MCFCSNPAFTLVKSLGTVDFGAVRLGGMPISKTVCMGEVNLLYSAENTYELCVVYVISHLFCVINSVCFITQIGFTDVVMASEMIL
jgi:hypothetical protein